VNINEDCSWSGAPAGIGKGDTAYYLIILTVSNFNASQPRSTIATTGQSTVEASGHHI
jgi:hypothetical protein